MLSRFMKYKSATLRQAQGKLPRCYEKLPLNRSDVSEATMYPNVIKPGPKNLL